MKTMRRTLLCVVLALVLVFGFSPMTTFAEEIATTDDVTLASEPDAENTASADEPAEAEEEQASDTASQAPAEEKTSTAKKTKAKAAPALAKEATPSTASTADVIYLGGTGSDEADGLTKETPVKTFAKAKELMASTGAEEIRMVSTVRITANETWDLDGKVVTRDDSFDHDPMVKTSRNTTLTLQNIILDGGSERGMKIKGTGSYQQVCSIIDMATGGCYKLELNEGAVLRNNYAYQTSTGATNVRGGAITAQSSGYYHYININGGKIVNCKTSDNGGGIYGYYATVVTMKSGSIENCSAPNTSSDYAGMGGGVYLNGVGLFRMYGGEVKNCSSAQYGGGVFLDYGTFKMEGGSMTGNTTGKCGGAVLLGNETDGHITAGEMSNNTANGNGPATCFAGGAIYVASHEDGDRGDSTLEITNALITDNSAAYDGGGVANCPLGNFRLGEDAAIFGNSSENGAKDVAVVRKGDTTSNGVHWTFGDEDATAYVSATMLGGANYHWSDPDGNKYPLTDLFDVHHFYGNANNTENTASAEATFVMKGNKAPKGLGGAIASNGVTFIGKEAVNAEMSFEKVWDDNGQTIEHPDSVKVLIKCDGEDFGYVNVTAEDDWKLSVTDLPDGHEYTAEEVIPDVSGGVYKDSYKNEEGKVTITNTFSKDIDVEISKTDVGGQELAGAKLTVTGTTAAGKDIEPIEWTSGTETHKISVQPGTYTLTETTAPEGYEKAESITFKVELDEDGNSKVTVDGKDNNGKLTMVDDYSTHKVIFSKTDIGGEELEGATIELQKQETGEVVESWETDGKAKEFELKPGTYVFHEVAAPDGYQVATDITFEVTLTGEIITKDVEVAGDDENIITMVDDFVPHDADVPQGDNDEPEEEADQPEETQTVPDKTPQNAKPSSSKTTTKTVTKTKHAPKTGDNQSMALCIVLMLAALIAIFTVLQRRNHR